MSSYLKKKNKKRAVFLVDKWEREERILKYRLIFRFHIIHAKRNINTLQRKNIAYRTHYSAV